MWNNCVTRKEETPIAFMFNSNTRISEYVVSDYTAVAAPTEDGQLKWQLTTSIQLVWLKRLTGSQPSH